MSDEPNKPRYARNNKEIARALGLKPSRLTLVEIGTWRARKDFPVKGRKGYVVEELTDWHGAFCRADVPIRPAFGDKRPTTDSESEDEQRLREIRKSSLLTKYAEGKRLSPEELREAGLSRPEPSGSATLGSLPAIASGLAAIASIIATHFKVQCERQYINDWRHGKKLPAGAPPFPPPTSANRFEVAECLAWYEKWKLPNRNTSTPDLQGLLIVERDKSELEEIAHGRIMRAAELGKYIERDVARRTCAAALKQLHGFVRQLVERESPQKRKQFVLTRGAPAELAAALYEYDLKRGQALIDAIEEKCSVIGSETKEGKTK